MDAEKKMMQRRIDNLIERLEKVERERKALLKEVNGFCWSCKNKKPSKVSHNLSICEFFPKSLGMIRAKCEHWEWRGLCKENGGAEDGQDHPD